MSDIMRVINEMRPSCIPDSEVGDGGNYHVVCHYDPRNSNHLLGEGLSIERAIEIADSVDSIGVVHRFKLYNPERIIENRPKVPQVGLKAYVVKTSSKRVMYPNARALEYNGPVVEGRVVDEWEQRMHKEYSRRGRAWARAQVRGISA